MLPKDPFILLSVVNTMLRDKYPSLDALKDDIGDEASDIEEKLASLGYHYDSDLNCFS